MAADDTRGGATSDDGRSTDEPLFESAGGWSWNIRGDTIEINVHEVRRTVTISARDLRRMGLAVGTLK